MSRLKKGGAIAVLCCTLVGGFEGLRRFAYRDVVGVATICYGETKNVRMGDRKTKTECDALLVSRLDEFAAGVERCIRRPMSDRTEVAFVSLAYNIGIGGFCASSTARLFNAGAERPACEAIMKWNRAGGVAVPGLTRRRAAERDLCLAGLA